MKDEEKNIIYGMGLVGILLILIVVFGGIHNMTGASTIEKPEYGPWGPCIAATENMQVSHAGRCIAEGSYNLDDNDAVDGAIIFNESYGTLACETTNTIIYGSNAAGSYGVYSSGKENITIRNCTFVGYNSGVRIDSASGGNKNVTIENVTVYNSTYGFYLKDVINGTIPDNIIYNATHGMYLETVVDIPFRNNEIYNISKNAIHIGNGCYPPGNTFADNTIHNNTGNGFNVSSQSQRIENNTIYNTGNKSFNYAAIKVWAINNIIKSNNITDDGIQIINANHTSILGNTITNPADYGIYLNSSNETNVTKNIINGSGCVGINLTGTNVNWIYNNYINCSGGINAFDDGTNYWNITYNCAGISNLINGSCMGGNYWGDYSGNDTDDDGIGNTSLPYNSTSNITNGGDYLPLVCLDADGDGYSPSPYFTSYCGVRDCNDGNSAVNPGASENCNNNIDDDCDGKIDCDDNDCNSASACKKATEDDNGGSTSGTTAPYTPIETVKKKTYTYLEPGMSFNEKTNTLTAVVPKSQILESLKINLKEGADLPEKVSVESKVKTVGDCSDVSGVSDNTILSCSNIYSTIPNKNINSTTIRYKVPNILLAEKRIDINSLFAVRKNESLPVKEVRSDESFTYFDVTSPGFSLFTVAGKSISEIIIDMRPLQISLVVLAISAVLWIILLGYHFKQKPPKEKPLSPHIAGLHSYVQRSKGMGFSKREIKNALRISGWPEKHIVEALKKFFG
ncbi:PGF-pre-PGF domain-containing protein [Candidatus Woesearchaeota archaeon]|nr:PGF-pre-PGF domain-containing protein [Candidatus Woesearchaeota archaeon]